MSVNFNYFPNSVWDQISGVSAEGFHSQKQIKEKNSQLPNSQDAPQHSGSNNTGSSTAHQPNQTVQVQESLAKNNCSTTLKRNTGSLRRTAEKKVLLKSPKVPTEVLEVDSQRAKEPQREARLRPRPGAEDCVSSSETRCKNFLSSQHLGRRQTCPGRLLTRMCSSRRLRGLCGRRSNAGGQEKKI